MPDPCLDGYSKIWAPHVIKRGGRFFMFFTASLNGGLHCIYSAVSSTNAPRSYSRPTLLLCAANRKGETWEAIDPGTYETAAGNTYLVWRSGHIQPDFPVGDYQIRAAMLSFSGSSVSLTTGTPRMKLLEVENETVVERPTSSATTARSTCSCPAVTSATAATGPTSTSPTRSTASSAS